MSDKPMMPKIVQPLCFSLRSLKNHTARKSNAYPCLNTMERLKATGDNCNTVRVNVLTPSPERFLPSTKPEVTVLTPSPERLLPSSKPEVTVISDDSDVEEPYSLPPTPSISDDSDDLFVLSCLPKVKSVTSLSETCRNNGLDNRSLVLIPTVKSVTTVRESDEIPSNLRVHPCHWRDCHTSCETPESLHIHILSLHATVEAMSCGWADCSVYGKKFRNVALFGRHVQTHTGALNFACIWEGCSERFKEDKYLQIHLSTHLRQKFKKKSDDNKKKKKEEEHSKQIARSQCLRKRRLVSNRPVIRQNFINILDENGIDKKTMKFLRKKVCQIKRCADGYRAIELSADKVGYRHDAVTGKQWLLQAKRERTLMRWSTNKNAKICVPWKKCPDDVLIQLGLLAKQPRRRKQSRTLIL
ncbi:transcriptional activator cubitus interruptus-like isoform X2 [Bolinopsis microptera]|uniref:transcriptional activator cubitus interruptus-like isoform X2 n=1 Tax=Bolinopsis microptera TaxID=2820187 RepID=UPI003078C5F1